MHCYLTRTKAATPATKETKQFTSVASQTSIYMYNIKTVRMYSINHIPIRVPRHIYMSIIPRKGYAKRLRRSTVKHSQKKTPHQSKNRHVRIENKNQASKPAETVELLFSNRGAFVETPRPRTVGLGSKYEWM